MARKQIGEKARFQIFQRDSFTCQYCGRKPPDVVLWIDHVVAVANGGSNDSVNLVTSCDACNRGKGCLDLADVPDSVAAVVAARMERQKQTEEYNLFLLEQRKARDEEIGRLEKSWNTAWKQYGRYAYQMADSKLSIDGSQKLTLRRFLEHLTLAEIVEAMEIAHGRKTVYQLDDAPAWRYFCGICWNKIRGGRDAANQVN